MAVVSLGYIYLLTDAIHTASRVYRQKRSSRHTADCACDD